MHELLNATALVQSSKRSQHPHMQNSSVRPRAPLEDTVAPPLKAAHMQPAAVLVHSKRTAFHKLADFLRLGTLAMYSSQAVLMRRWTVQRVYKQNVG